MSKFDPEEFESDVMLSYLEAGGETRHAIRRSIERLRKDIGAIEKANSLAHSPRFIWAA